MGQERESTLRIAKRRIEGEALLETAEIIFRPVDGSKRLKFAFADIVKSVKAVDGELRFHTGEGPAVLELGPAAEKWAEKILHPKSRPEKLGVKNAMQVSLLGRFDDDFQKRTQRRDEKCVSGKNYHQLRNYLCSRRVIERVERCRQDREIGERRNGSLGRLSKREERNHRNRRDRSR